MNATFSKKNRLRKRRDFLRIQRSGMRISGPFFVLVGRLISSPQEGRAGLTVSKAIGKAHVRNLIKRRLRHILRQNRHLFQKYDLVIVAHPSITSATFDNLQTELLGALTALNEKILSKTKNKNAEKKS